MAIIRCNSCGGDLRIEKGSTVAQCEHCGCVQTVPSADNEKKLALFSRANGLRLACEFDRAAGVYESIIAEFPVEAEAYWGLVLCRYGIEYVDDPRTGRKIPTCHRSSFNSIMEDRDFEQALKNADVIARRVYQENAAAFEEIRKGIVEVSSKEEPYDIFICYKETDENGDRTLDSVLAQDIYDALVEKDYRVFFARISLEDKLGQAYEPHIFAALNSADVMLVVGTQADRFNAVWVKNEWSRFLQLIASGRKKYLIPCFKGIKPNEMPEEFARLQSQDLGKIGAIQDLLLGVSKLIPRAASSSAARYPSALHHEARGSHGVGEIPDLIARGQKVKAIKLIRETYGYSLAQANELAKSIEQALARGETATLPPTDNACAALPVENAPVGMDDIMALVRDGRRVQALKLLQVEFNMNPQQARERVAQIQAELEGMDSVKSPEQLELERARDESRREKAKAIQEERQAAQQVEEFRAQAHAARDSDDIFKLSSRTRYYEGRAAYFKERIAYWELRIQKDEYRIASQSGQDTVTFTSRINAAQEDWLNEQLNRILKDQDNAVQDANEANALAERYIQLSMEANNKALSQEYENKAENYEKLAAKAKEKIARCEQDAQRIENQLSRTRSARAPISTPRTTTATASSTLKNTSDALERPQTGDKLGTVRERLAPLQRLLMEIDLKDKGFLCGFAAVGQGGSVVHYEAGLQEQPVIIPQPQRQGVVALDPASKRYITESSDCRAEYSYAEGGLLRSIVVKWDGRVYTRNWPDNDVAREVATWENVVDIAYAPSTNHICMGLTKDGRVLTALSHSTQTHFIYKGYADKIGQWRNIVAIAACSSYYFGLSADGKVLCVGGPGRLGELENWNNIISISASIYQITGLKADGTVVSQGLLQWSPYDVSAWRNVVAILSATCYTVGVTADGKLLRTMTYSYNIDEKNNVSNIPRVLPGYQGYFEIPGIKLFDNPSILAQECRQGLAQIQAQWAPRSDTEAVIENRLAREEMNMQQIAKLRLQRYTLTTRRKAILNELENVKGLFAAGRKKKLEEDLKHVDVQLGQIDAQIASLKS